MKVQPVPGRILVKKHVMSRKTSGGIIVPDSAVDDRQILADVIACGNPRMITGGSCQSCPASVGDVVVFSKCCGDAIKIDGDEHLIIDFNDVLAVVRE